MTPLTISIAEASNVLGLGRTTLFSMIKSKQLDILKVGRRTLIKTESIRALVDAPGR